MERTVRSSSTCRQETSNDGNVRMRDGQDVNRELLLDS
jgi:hypothetical protein